MDNANTVTMIENRKLIKVFHNTQNDKFQTNNIISVQDAEMDKRALAAVKSAVAKAKVCNKPIARYDLDTKRVYLEYPNGERKYVR